MEDFIKFIESIESVLQGKKLGREDIAYINISDLYWMSANDFFSLKQPPRVWSKFRRNHLGTWDVPSEFKIVFRNYDWLEYYTNWGDEYYNSFVFRNSPKRSSKKYFERFSEKRSISNPN